jgi:hypothetical protein
MPSMIVYMDLTFRFWLHSMFLKFTEIVYRSSALLDGEVHKPPALDQHFGTLSPHREDFRNSYSDLFSLKSNQGYDSILIRHTMS